MRRGGSAALDLAYVACGRFDGYWEQGVAPWDVAAGSLLVASAGGQLSTYSGAPYDGFGPQIVASNGHLHEAALAFLGALPDDDDDPDSRPRGPGSVSELRRRDG